MDTTKILLDKQISKTSINKDKLVNISLVGNHKKMPTNDIVGIIEMDNLYIQERDESTKYRLIFNINPICSNVLFNQRSEIVKDEGSDNCTLLIGDVIGKTDAGTTVNTTNLTYLQAIRDTEYTHPNVGPYVYHCGMDIFNNPMIRNTEFTHINKVSKYTEDDKKVFNTLWDYERTNEGKEVTETRTNGFRRSETESAASSDLTSTIRIHTYNNRNLSTMEKAYGDKLLNVDGWYGFTNRGNIKIPNGKSDGISFNRIMNNNKSCEFIDMYPDRSLYSFIPKYNKLRHRIEKNWEYCLTYPYKSDKAKFNSIIGCKNVNGIKIISSGITYTNLGNELLQLKTGIRHNLSSGDYVVLYYHIKNDGYYRSTTKIKVATVGTQEEKDTDFIFNIKYDDIYTSFPKISKSVVDIEKTADTLEGVDEIYVKKLYNNIECQYYFRKFKKLMKININNEGEDYDSEINKIAFAENIYGDRAAQIVYTEPIDIEGLSDNLGRELSEIYLTVIKANYGYEKWYKYIGGNNKTETIGNKTVEYSHCFGKVESGIEMPVGAVDYNVRRIHNVNFNDFTNTIYSATSKIYGAVLQKGKPIEDNVNINSYDEFYGDIVEFSPSQYKETVLSEVKYRFNTAQRETTNSKYFDIYYDELTYDDDKALLNNTNFTVSTNKINKAQDILGNDYLIAGNIAPEGYYYKAHNKVQLKKISDTLNSENGLVLNCEKESITLTNKEGYDYVTIISPILYGLAENDNIYLYNTQTTDGVWGLLYQVKGAEITIKVNENLISLDDLKNGNCKIIEAFTYIPTYAVYQSSFQNFVWRENVKMSELNPEDDIYNRPFANGCNYIEQTINFYLKRQDPFGEYGLLKPENGEGPHEYVSDMKEYRIVGEKIDTSDIDYVASDKNIICY